MLLSLKSRELNGGGQAGNGLIINSVGSSRNSVHTRRDLRGELDRGLDLNLALLDRALQTNALGLFTEVKRLLQEANVPIPHVNVDISALQNCLLDNALGKNGELLALERRVGVEVKLGDFNPLGRLKVANQEGGVAGDGFVGGRQTT